jgi:hypothetical protein
MAGNASIRLSAALFAVAVAVAVATVWVSPAAALPSFAGQTGLPCVACHVGGFGPQLTPFGIAFRANGYTLRGGSGVWAHELLNLVVSPSYEAQAKAQTPAPPGYGTNNFFNALGTGTALYIAGGTTLGSGFGVGGFEQWGFSGVPGQSIIGSEATSDFKITKRLNLEDHSLLLGLDFTNTPSGGDPYNSLYNGFAFPYLTPFVGPFPSATPAISALGTSVYGLSLYGLYDNTWYLEAGAYESWSPGILSSMNISPSSLGVISGATPYLRVAHQHSWGSNFLEVGGVFFDPSLQQVPGALSTSATNSFADWGFDTTYERTIGEDILTVTGNVLFESQSLGASFAAGLSGNSSNNLTQVRVAGSYYWHSTYGFTLAYEGISGSTDSVLYAPAPLVGSANGSPNSQAIVAQVDWTPFGKDTSQWGYPGFNVRVALQYTWYLQFNGGTTNYDGSGRNASDNNTLMFFTWFAF